MAFQLKPNILETATNAADIQKLMRADLKGNTGKTGLKFIAAKNVVIGGKLTSLFIVTDLPTRFEALLKTKHPNAYRAKGTCDLEKDDAGKTRVLIRTSTGQMTPQAIAKMLPEAVARDRGYVAQVATQPRTDFTLKPTGIDTGGDSGGVAEWDKEEYILKSVENVIASMTPDGKIGSIYFEGDGRIRTTHGHGPQRAEHLGQTIVQFNIDQGSAEADYQAEMHDKIKKIDKDRKLDKIKRKKAHKKLWEEWIKATLGKATPDNLPTWAKMVTNPDTAFQVGPDGVPNGKQLIEIFKGINGKVEGWHPSRGVAAKLKTDKQTISVLHAAIQHIDSRHAQVNVNKSLDKIIADRRTFLELRFSPGRKNPGKAKMKELWADETIAKQIKKLGLKKPSLEEMQKSQVMKKRIERIFDLEFKEMLENDVIVKTRMKVLSTVRNREFYDFVKSRLPNSSVVAAMREPNKVKV